MPDWISPGLLDGVGVVALIVLVGWMNWTGRLITRREADALRHDRDEWRTESRLKDSQIEAQSQQLRILEEVGETMAAVLGSIQRLAARDKADDR